MTAAGMVVLLATGLLGIAYMGARRRRRTSQGLPFDV